MSLQKQSNGPNKPTDPKKKQKKDKLKSEEIFPKRFGLNYNPPMVILEFNQGGSLYLKKMRLQKLTDQGEPAQYLNYLKKKYDDYFEDGKIEDKQVQKQIKQLQNNYLKHKDKKTGPSAKNMNSLLEKPAMNITKKDKPTDEYSNKYGKLKEQENMLEKKCPNQYEYKGADSDLLEIEPKMINPNNRSIDNGDEDFTDQMLDDDFDDAFEEIDDDELFNDLDDYKDDEDDMEVDEILQREARMMATHGCTSRITEDDDEDIEDSYNMEQLGIKCETNLNRLSTSQVNYHKKKMDDEYNSNRVIPGHPDFKYDIEKDFKQEEDNEWDSDLDNSDDESDIDFD